MVKYLVYCCHSNYEELMHHDSVWFNCHGNDFFSDLTEFPFIFVPGLMGTLWSVWSSFVTPCPVDHLLSNQSQSLEERLYTIHPYIPSNHLPIITPSLSYFFGFCVRVTFNINSLTRIHQKSPPLDTTTYCFVSRILWKQNMKKKYVGDNKEQWS